MKVNLILDENNVIQSAITYPLDENGILVEIEDYTLIHCGISKYENNTIYLNDEEYNKQQEWEKVCDEIETLKKELKDSDYQCLKHIDGELTDLEYQPIKEHRQALREKINELEGGLK